MKNQFSTMVTVSKVVIKTMLISELVPAVHKCSTGLQKSCYTLHLSLREKYTKATVNAWFFI